MPVVDWRKGGVMPGTRRGEKIRGAGAGVPRVLSPTREVGWEGVGLREFCDQGADLADRRMTLRGDDEISFTVSVGGVFDASVQFPLIL